jgi:endoplasmic reticulum-Golgi intermediate compartment protein 3
MALRTRFTRLDAFTKTVEDARVRTTSGGIVTIGSLLIILWLMWGEWADFRTIVIRPELIVDKSRGEKMEIHMNVTFPRIPCELLTLDVMDVSGEVQSEIVHGVSKVRLSSVAQGSGVLEVKEMEIHTDSAVHLDPEYCGECYGAPAPENASKAGCCNTCEEVRNAYASISWSFGKGEQVEQCNREHYAERLEAQKGEGCRVVGSIRVNKVAGNFHFAPGKSYSNGNVHVHDLDNYFKDGFDHSFTHQVHTLRFGPEIPARVVQALGNGATSANLWTNHHVNPLDGTEQHTDEKAFNYMYFVKVVSTAYLPLGWERYKGSSIDTGAHSYPSEWVGLGMLGHGDLGSVETHQYSVTSHKRSVHGGDDEKDGHKERIHAKGGIPGVFFQYVSLRSA